MITWVEIVSAVLGLGCVFLAGRNSKRNFWVGYAYNAFLFVLFLRQHLYCVMLLQLVSFGINLFGHFRWTHPRENERSASDEARLKVSTLNAQQWSFFMLVTCIFGVMLASGMDWLSQKWPDVFLPDPSPWLDAFILAFTLMAQYLSAQKCWECWLIWIGINIANIALYLVAGLYVMPVVSALYLVNAVWSLITWRKLYRNNE